MKKANSTPYLILRWFLILLIFFPMTSAIAGEYVTFEILKNKRLANNLEKKSGILSTRECQKLCVKHKQCEAFAISTFERACQLYELILGTPPVIHTGYTLYVRSKTEEEGFYVSGMNYIKFIVTYENFYGAKKICEEMQGMLVADRNEEVHELLKKQMQDRYVFKAYIGITDEEKEGEWKYMDKGAVTEPNWDYNGEWYRRDKNCAYMDITGNWYHINCQNPLPFFCQIPMF